MLLDLIAARQDATTRVFAEPTRSLAARWIIWFTCLRVGLYRIGKWPINCLRVGWWRAVRQTPRLAGAGAKQLFITRGAERQPSRGGECVWSSEPRERAARERMT
jgi:hypothetical protein